MHFSADEESAIRNSNKLQDILKERLDAERSAGYYVGMRDAQDKIKTILLINELSIEEIRRYKGVNRDVFDALESIIDII
jgi:hypothetical protein